MHDTVSDVKLKTKLEGFKQIGNWCEHDWGGWGDNIIYIPTKAQNPKSIIKL